MNVFHRDIRALRNKSDELMNPLVVDRINPHILCLSEPHTDGLYPRLQLSSPKPTERKNVYFLLQRIKALTKLIPRFTV